jgi:capsular polysaccharide biosynthesis protein
MHHSKIISRQLPVNYKSEDLSIFEKALKYTFNVSPAIRKRSFVFYNFNALKAYNKARFFREKRMFVDVGTLKPWEIVRSKIFIKGYIFFDHWSLNYFHWFTEVIPKIVYAAKQDNDIRVLIPAWLYEVDFVNQSLSLVAGITVKVFSQTAFFFNAEVIDLCYTSGNYSAALIGEVRDVLQKKPIRQNASIPKRIFVFRTSEAKRGILNFDELIPVLKKFDIAIIDFTKYPWAEQYSMAAGADMLIGVHGAGLTNMLFMKEGGVVLELRRDDDGHNNCYFSLADACRHKYWYQLCAVDDVSIETQQNNFYVDINLFEKNILAILNPKP